MGQFSIFPFYPWALFRGNKVQVPNGRLSELYQTRFLVFLVGKDGISADPKKVEATSIYPRPTTKKEMRQSLGFESFDRSFIKAYSEKCEVLNEMTQKQGKFCLVTRKRPSL
jgi:hypothetical protein